ncbi:MAG: hypothetical protein ACE5WD_06165 [Candidatus Aminicenantia bacterium]
MNQFKKYIKSNKLVLILSVFLLFSISFGQKDYYQEEVFKVKKILKKIKQNENEKFKKKAALTEKEVNSYLDYRLKEERTKVLEEIKLKFLKDNLIEGKAVINLKEGENNFLKIYFNGFVIVKEKRAKFDLKKLFIEDQPVPGPVLEFIIAYLSRKEGYEPLSIFSWYDLPYGIENIKTQPGKLIIYY